MVSSELLGMAFEPEERYENPDGTDIVFDKDFFGKARQNAMAGPLAEKTNEIVF